MGVRAWWKRGHVGWRRAGVSLTAVSLPLLVWSLAEVGAGAMESLAGWIAELTMDEVFATLGAAASAIALVGFLPWALQQRRRPEAMFQWLISTSGERDLRWWLADDVPEVEAGATIIVEASIANGGDAGALSSRTNFLIPEYIALRGLRADAEPARFTTDGAIEDPFMARYVASTFDLRPNLAHIQRFELTLPPGAPAGDVRLVMTFAHERLNPTGRRRLPVLRAEYGGPTSKAGEKWPPVGSSRRWWSRHAWHRPTAQPRGRILCGRGYRADVRDFRITAKEPPAGTT
jgi:hypothetical protein